MALPDIPTIVASQLYVPLLVVGVILIGNVIGIILVCVSIVCLSFAWYKIDSHTRLLVGSKFGLCGGTNSCQIYGLTNARKHADEIRRLVPLIMWQKEWQNEINELVIPPEELNVVDNTALNSFLFDVLNVPTTMKVSPQSHSGDKATGHASPRLTEPAVDKTCPYRAVVVNVTVEVHSGGSSNYSRRFERWQNLPSSCLNELKRGDSKQLLVDVGGPKNENAGRIREVIRFVEVDRKISRRCKIREANMDKRSETNKKGRNVINPEGSFTIGSHHDARIHRFRTEFLVILVEDDFRKEASRTYVDQDSADECTQRAPWFLSPIFYFFCVLFGMHGVWRWYMMRKVACCDFTLKKTVVDVRRMSTGFEPIPPSSRPTFQERLTSKEGMGSRGHSKDVIPTPPPSCPPSKKGSPVRAVSGDMGAKGSPPSQATSSTTGSRMSYRKQYSGDGDGNMKSPDVNASSPGSKYQADLTMVIEVDDENAKTRDSEDFAFSPMQKLARKRPSSQERISEDLSRQLQRLGSKESVHKSSGEGGKHVGREPSKDAVGKEPVPSPSANLPNLKVQSRNVSKDSVRRGSKELIKRPSGAPSLRPGAF